MALTVESQKVIYTGPPDAVTDDLLNRLRQHKPELLRLLSGDAVENRRAQYTHYSTGHPDARPVGLMPRPAVAWPADLTAMLRRVSVFYEWTQTDVQDFIQWARRSPEGLADARVFLQAKAAKLPKPGLSVRA